MSTSGSSTTRMPVTHTVEVGKADYTFVPDIVLAEVGDYIEYAFYPRNHSVVRADYEYPCVPYELVNTSPGFYSGFFPVDTILDDPPTYTVEVNNTDPFFVYCSGPDACIEYGMVSVVNPSANMSLDQHRQWAKAAQFVLQPGDKWPTEGTDPADQDADDGEHATTSATLPATVTVSATPTATSDIASTSASSHHDGLSVGAIAGIAIGAAAIALIAGIAIWICGRRSRGRRNPEGMRDGTWFLGTNTKKDAYQSGSATPGTMPPAYNPHGMPVMTQASKGYPGVNASVVEHYGSPASSPPPQMSPHYAQQNFPPHVLDPAAFNHNSGYHSTGGFAQNSTQPQPQQQFYRPEIDSGTPAPRSPPPIGMPVSLPPTDISGMTAATVAGPMDGRNSMSMSNGNSRGGSPDIMHEMNALRSHTGTLNQAGGMMPTIRQPVAQRDGTGIDIKKIETSG